MIAGRTGILACLWWTDGNNRMDDAVIALRQAQGTAVSKRHSGGAGAQFALSKFRDSAEGAGFERKSPPTTYRNGALFNRSLRVGLICRHCRPNFVTARKGWGSCGNRGPWSESRFASSRSSAGIARPERHIIQSQSPGRFRLRPCRSSVGIVHPIYIELKR